MKLSKREKKIAIGLGATLAVVGLLELVIFPYFDSLAAIDKDTGTAIQLQSDNNSLFNRQTEKRKVWTHLIDGGLTSDENKAESQALSAVSDWASQSGVQITQQKTERATDALPFQIIKFRVTGLGSTPSIARFLFSLETATIPVHVDDVTITPRTKEGTDDLQIQMSLSTLCLKPDADTAGKTAVTQADGGGQSWN